MTILEKKSNRKKKSILNLVEKGEYSVSYALMLVENLSDEGKLTDSDYEELAKYLEEKLNSEESEMQEEIIESEIPEENIGTEIQEDNSSIEEIQEEIEENSDETENTKEQTAENEEIIAETGANE